MLSGPGDALFHHQSSPLLLLFICKIIGGNSGLFVCSEHLLKAAKLPLKLPPTTDVGSESQRAQSYTKPWAFLSISISWKL